MLQQKLLKSPWESLQMHKEEMKLVIANEDTLLMIVDMQKIDDNANGILFVVD